MTLDKMKELFKTGEWICVSSFKGDSSVWRIVDDITYTGTMNHQLIHKKHEEILDQYFKKEFEIGLNGSFVKDFVETYNQEHNYTIMYLYPIK